MLKSPVLALGLLATLTFPALAADDEFKAPDSIVLKNGKVVSGLIVRNTALSVVMQEKDKENTYPKSDIVRIRDEANVGMAYTEIDRKGELPAWRVIANDLRTHDYIKSLVEIPATIIDEGEFKNVPYKSFRVNGYIEMNVYGNPENPAGLEMGIYFPRSGDKKLRKLIRSYLAGYLTTRAEVGALYSLGLDEGKKTVGNITIEITPPTGEDAFGAWWISLYNKKSLAAQRLSDAAYAKITRPVDEVVDRKGRIIIPGWENGKFDLKKAMHDVSNTAQTVLFGFYRDKNGDFRLLLDKPKEEQAN